jgi:hypothetical protein
MYNTVEEFAEWYMRKGFPIRPPFKDPVYVTDISYSYVLYRAGQYQAELYLIKPNHDTPDHSHPGVESIIMIWGGDLNTRIDGQLVEYPSTYNSQNMGDGTSNLFGACSKKLTDKETHAVITGPKGGALLSLEKWPNGIVPTSVTVRWQGNTLGKDHDQTIEELNYEH